MLRLNADRTVSVTLDGIGDVTLRPPTIGEWRKIREAYRGADEAFRAEADAWAAAAVEDPDSAGPEPTAGDYVWSDGNPYGHAFAQVVEALSSAATLDADALPMWATDPSLYATLYEHWKAVPVVRLHEPTGPAIARETATSGVSEDPGGMAPVPAGDLPRALRDWTGPGAAPAGG